MKKEVLTLRKESAPANTNEASINMVMADKDFMKALDVTPEDIIKQVKISEKEFKEISNYVTNYKGTFAELYKELKGWNLGYANPEQDENNLFDCYYKSLLITVWVDEGVLKVSPNNVYVYPNDITKVDSDELFHLDFDKPIDYSKINTKITESRKSVGRKMLKKENVSNVNDEEISRLLSDKDFINMLHITPKDVEKQVEISKKQFEEISSYVANYKGTFGELYKELGGWNLGDNNVEQDDDNLFDCYYKSLLITVNVDNGKLSVSPHDVYIYAQDITDVDTDEILHLDFDKPIDFSKVKVTEGRKSLGHSIAKKQESKKLEDKELLVEDDLNGLKRYADELKTYIGVNKNRPEMQSRQKELDSIVEMLWVALEDVPFIENKNKELILDGEYLDFPKGTTRNEIWKWFDNMYSKGVAYLVNDFDITAHRVTESDKEDLDEAFYEKICRAYIDTVNLEWVTTNPENNDSVVHGYFADDEDANKYKDKITPENFKDIAYEGYTEEEIENGDVDWYEYDTWEDFYEDYVKDEIAYDINDIGVYSDGSTDYDEGINHWDFYISEEDLTKLGLWNEATKSEFLDESKKVIEKSTNNLKMSKNNNLTEAIDFDKLNKYLDVRISVKALFDKYGANVDKTMYIDEEDMELISYKTGYILCTDNEKCYVFGVKDDKVALVNSMNIGFVLTKEQFEISATVIDDLDISSKITETINNSQYQKLINSINYDWKNEKRQVGNFNRKHSVGLKLRLTIYKDGSMVQTFYDINKFNKWANNNDLSGCKAVMEDGTFNLNDEFEIDDTRITYIFKEDDDYLTI